MRVIYFAGGDTEPATACWKIRRYVSDEKQNLPGLRTMVSLAIVAELAYRSATNAREVDEKTLNDVARAIAGCVDIFECQEDAKPNAVSSDEIRHGHFGGGGSTLDFSNGRASRKNLCIRASDLSRAIVEVNHLFPPQG